MAQLCKLITLQIVQPGLTRSMSLIKHFDRGKLGHAKIESRDGQLEHEYTGQVRNICLGRVLF